MTKIGHTSSAMEAHAKTPWIVGLIFLVGLLLRLFQLGADNFWIDEVGVILAAQQPSFREMLQAARSHVMGMPLDYVIAWLMVHISQAENWLRLPAALWGAATVPVVYALFARLSTRKVAWLAALLLAVSPLHVQYSQELRFYAPLVFFYLLSTWLLLRAIQDGRVSRWVEFIVATAVGMFFHIYVPLAAIHGVVWLWLSHGKDPAYTPQRKHFLRSLAVLLLASLAAILLFGGVFVNVQIPLLLGNDSLVSVLAVGFGWLPFYANFPALAWIFGALCFLLAMVGITAEVASDKAGLRSMLIASLALQIIGIIGMNALKNYFLAPRQFLMFLPFLLFYTSLGINVVSEKWAAANRLGEKQLQAALLGLLLAASLPALANYYTGDKGRIAEVSRQVQQAWQPGERIAFIPDFELNSFAYYWRKWGYSEELEAAAIPLGWERLSLAAQPAGPAIIVTYADLLPEQEAQMRSLSYEAIYVPAILSPYSYKVWELNP